MKNFRVGGNIFWLARIYTPDLGRYFLRTTKSNEPQMLQTDLKRDGRTEGVKEEVGYRDSSSGN